MIVYQATKEQFCEDVLNDVIEAKIHQTYQKLLGRSSKGEITAWKNSMQYMDRVLNHTSVPDDCGVAIEYQIPQSGKRIDFILTGASEQDKECAILIELKQWSTATINQKDGVINSFVGGSVRELTHPSYQAWSYASLLYNFNETVLTDNINLQPCAYLHNYQLDDVIMHQHYQDYIDKAPVFLKGDAQKLRAFINQFVKKGDRNKMLYRIDSGKIKPSKMLADAMVGMLKGNQEFVMIDDQKLVFEEAMAMARKSSANKKRILIVKGGPGTGKSVVAVNLLVEITKLGLLTKYVSKNAAPRSVYQSKLTGSMKKGQIDNMFSGSGAFVSAEANAFDMLIVDEAHRLNEMSGLYGNLGENQIKEIVNASKSTVFFIDEDQRVTLKDIGTIDQIQRWAKYFDADVEITELSTQFRCSGADGYLAWLDNTLQIRDTVNTSLAGINYDFKIFSSPSDLRDAIYEKNKNNNKSRLVAGYCWKWVTKKNPTGYDIVFNDTDFMARWNLTTDGSLWIISPESVKEVGCIHTCQGLEVEYIGVIVGKDLIVRNGHVVTDASKRASSDKSVFGWRKLLKEKKQETAKLLDEIIKNTYRTLMTRGMKGCYVYFEDKETEHYFRERTESETLDKLLINK